MAEITAIEFNQLESIMHAVVASVQNSHEHLVQLDHVVVAEHLPQFEVDISDTCCVQQSREKLNFCHLDE